MKIYMQVTADEYELPMLVEDNLEEFCRKLGMSEIACMQHIYRKSNGRVKGFRIVRTDVDEDEEE